MLSISVAVFSQKREADAIDSLCNKAQRQFNNGNIENAILHINQALNIQEKTIGKKHPDHARTLHNIALINTHTQRYLL